MNLFSNAADAMLSVKTPAPRILIRTRLKSAVGDVELAVEDNGPGIPADAMARLFEPSFTTKPEGHGFGLSTCYRIIQNHGGWIAAANRPWPRGPVSIPRPSRGGPEGGGPGPRRRGQTPPLAPPPGSRRRAGTRA